jgi:hypothetical protein
MNWKEKEDGGARGEARVCLGPLMDLKGWGKGGVVVVVEDDSERRLMLLA